MSKLNTRILLDVGGYIKPVDLSISAEVLENISNQRRNRDIPDNNSADSLQAVADMLKLIAIQLIRQNNAGS